MRILKHTKEEMATITSEMRMKQALNSRSPAGAGIIHAPGDLVCVYREGDTRFARPFRIVRVQEKEEYVDCDGHLVLFNISKIIPERTLTGDGVMHAVHASLRPLVEQRHVQDPEALSHESVSNQHVQTGSWT